MEEDEINETLYSEEERNTNGEGIRPDGKEELQIKKARGTEGALVIASQNEAFREFLGKSTRRFRREVVSVDTYGGLPILVDMWVSDDKPILKSKKKGRE
jgi:hypothetical protein